MAEKTEPVNLTAHQAANQPPPFEDVNLFASDRVLQEALAREGGLAHVAQADRFGARMGSAEIWAWAASAHRHPPELRSFDRYGRRIDEVEFHPSYHAMMREGLEAGISALPWSGIEAGHLLHAALEFLLAEVEPSVCCPITMTYAAPGALKHAPDIAAEWLPLILAQTYDASSQPARSKRGVSIGMAMTERQGGSDVRANTTRAERKSDGAYRLVGHKWFCSAPMSDAFLTLAQTESGLTCFLCPRWMPEGMRNAIHVMRLKDKIGDRANASSEIEYHGAYAVRIGEEGRGVSTILDMVHHTRLDCAIAPAAYMRSGLAQALWHTSHRSAFDKTLIEHALMRQVLADLALESEAATVLAFRVARSFDESPKSEEAVLFSRLATPVAKYWLNKRVTNHVTECMECHGGAGYVEEWPIARLYRQAPLNGIWEGSGNVICLDVLRALSRSPQSGGVFLDEVKRASGANAHLDRAIGDVESQLKQPADESAARRLVESMALALQGALLVQHAPPSVSDAFCATRLGQRHFAYGAFAGTADVAGILTRAMPVT
jgi:putative acyl-CoA dehydrogenase